MIERPDFIDNRNGNTLAQALRVLLGINAAQDSEDAGKPPEEVCIATAFFSPAGFSQIAEALQPVYTVKLLVGSDPAFSATDERRSLDETLGDFEKRQMQVGLRRMENALHRERDRLPFTLSTAHALRRLIALLRAGNMEVRRYERAFLHAKAYILSTSDDANSKPEGVIVGSSNLTGAGLTQNLELNLGRYEPPVVAQARRWFADLWDEAVPYDLAVVFDEVLSPRTPWEIFIRVLWCLYGKEVEEDEVADQDLPLTSFQKHGAARALRLINEMGGVIVADEVGLGKTFIAGEILQTYLSRRQRVLLICPAALRDSTWKHFINTHQLFVECLSFEQLAGDIQVSTARSPVAGRTHILNPLDEYQLVIVDEAHNYRNPDAPTRAGALRRLMFGQKRDILMLTATPVNNSLWDLYHLLRFFLRQDARLAGRGILSIRQRFDRAMREDPSSLSPDVLYPIIDATTVKRTRQFVKKHYANDTISGPDGTPRPIVFPQPKALSVRYNLDDLLPGFFDRLEAALDPDGSDGIIFARYIPKMYLLDRDNEEDARARGIVGLLRSGLLKRFESSADAFRRSVQKMVREHSVFLNALSAGHVVTTQFIKEFSADDDQFEEVLEATQHREDATLYNTKSLRSAVERDRAVLEELADQVAAIEPERDPKLRALAETLAEIAEQAEQQATDAFDERQKRKVLVFSFFEDTVVWIRDYLHKEIERRPALLHYRDRIEVVSGSDDHGKVSRQAVVQGFAPVSMEAPQGKDNDRYDILITTDVLAEGVNLQQCRHIVNFDMPWNPMRLVQRHGRIDRIGSPHNRVFLRTIFPVDRLDRLLNLERRILDKLAMAAASVGVAAPIEGAAQGVQVFTETREEIEKLLADDPSLYERGGTVSATQTGEEYRQTLRKALVEDRERILGMPWKSGSGMVAGTRRGVFFCAVVGRESSLERTYLRFVAASDDWHPRTDNQAIEREIGTCLRLIECSPETPTWYPEILRERVYDFWEAARDDVLVAWMRETDPANLQPAIRPLNHRVADFIRANPPLGTDEERIERALDILESPWPRREEIMLREWFEANGRAGRIQSSFLIDQIIESGLEPTEPPDPLPPVSREDIELLCWLGIEPDASTLE